MKTKLLIVPFLLLTAVVFGQEKNISDEDKKTFLANLNKDFEGLKKEYDSIYKSYQTENQKEPQLLGLICLSRSICHSDRVRNARRGISNVRDFSASSI